MGKHIFIKTNRKSRMRGLLVTVLICSMCFLFLIVQLMIENKQKAVPAIVITFIFIMIVLSTYGAYKDNNLLQPIVIINIFVFFIFVARPIQVIWGDAILRDNHVFLIYNNLYGIENTNELPYTRTLLIGIIGLMSMYAGYYLSLFKKNRTFKQEKLDFDYSAFLNSKYEIKKGIAWYRFFLMTAGISCALFFIRYDYSVLISNAGKLSSAGISCGIIDIIWIQIGTCALIYSFLIRKKINLPSLIIIVAYLILIAAIAERAYIVNLLLCMLVLTYYIRFNKKINIRLVIVGIVIFASVIIYGSVRASNIGTTSNSTITDSILGEFSMFDMLLVSIDYETHFGKLIYWGVNYLTLFDGFIPHSIWPWKLKQFDFVHTELIFKGLYMGAVPTSLFGSLYFNFSYVGLIVGCFIFGKLFKKVYKELCEIRTRFSIGLYALFTTFLYDIIRVGDIGREFWTLMVYIGVYLIMGYFIKPKKEEYLVQKQ